MLVSPCAHVLMPYCALYVVRAYVLAHVLISNCALYVVRAYVLTTLRYVTHLLVSTIDVEILLNQ